MSYSDVHIWAGGGGSHSMKKIISEFLSSDHRLKTKEFTHINHRAQRFQLPLKNSFKELLLTKSLFNLKLIFSLATFAGKVNKSKF